MPEIQEEIDAFKLNYFGEFTIGLQIRRVGGSKLNDLQEEIMWDCVTNVSAAHTEEHVIWFLATDSTETREYAKQHYGDKVVFYNKSISRADMEGLKAAIVDI